MHEWVQSWNQRVVTDEETFEQEFEQRLRDSSTLAFRVAYGVLRHREDAEDVAQEAFTRAYRGFSQLRDRDRFRSWLVRMTWRLAIDRQRADRRRLAREQATVDAAAPERAAAAATGQERLLQLRQAIDALPEKLRVVLVLACIEGHDVREVASLLGIREGTVKSRLFLGRKKLAERLQWTAKPTSKR